MMRLTDIPNPAPSYPAEIFEPVFGPIFAVIGVIVAGVVMTVATVAALLILVKDDKGGAALAYAAAATLSVIVSALRNDWSTFVYCVLVLPAFFGLRWLFRKLANRFL